MKVSIYPRLAWTGIKNNKKLYIPYILSCTGMILMFYIIHSLSYSPALHNIKGGSSLEMILSLGKFVIAVFALLFLFYTNSFLIKKRNKEFGLYNVLGMDKNSISKIILLEDLCVFLVSLFAGLVLGIVFSKVAELCLLNVIRQEVSFDFTVSAEAVLYTLLIFAIIFAVIILRSLLLVRKLKPLDLLHSENVGEKPPKANWVLAIVGFIVLAAAYYMAVTIQAPLTALMMFFIAVIMVIAATYMLFIAGSVVMCKILQKNKKYYYKKQHFVSVSSMTYRMKRNGAGLASICILATMVLVMISITSSLYFGVQDSINARYPQNCVLAVETYSVDNMSDETIEKIDEKYEEVFKKHDFTPTSVVSFRYANITGLLSGDSIDPDSEKYVNSVIQTDNLRNIFFVSVKDYNRIMGTDYELNGTEALLCPVRCSYKDDTLNIADCSFNIVGKTDKYLDVIDAATFILPSFCMVISDYEVLRPLEALNTRGGYPMLSLKYYYGFDSDVKDSILLEVYNDQKDVVSTFNYLSPDGGYRYSGGCIAQEKDDFFATFGGLFFLGIMLAVVFIFAAAMIIYYKQVSEGYEDKSRFEIMQKVGMTKEDIKKSINSQVLTVFFMPLICAGIHLCFAFPMIWKILMLFNLHNMGLVAATTAGAFVAFGIIYTLIYKATAKAYYAIVA